MTSVRPGTDFDSGSDDSVRAEINHKLVVDQSIFTPNAENILPKSKHLDLRKYLFSAPSKLGEKATARASTKQPPLEITIWDFNSQRVMFGCASIFLRSRVFIILTISVASIDVEQQVEDWLKFIDGTVAGARVFMIFRDTSPMTTADKHPKLDWANNLLTRFTFITTNFTLFKVLFSNEPGWEFQVQTILESEISRITPGMNQTTNPLSLFCLIRWELIVPFSPQIFQTHQRRPLHQPDFFLASG